MTSYLWDFRNMLGEAVVFLQQGKIGPLFGVEPRGLMTVMPHDVIQ